MNERYIIKQSQGIQIGNNNTMVNTAPLDPPQQEVSKALQTLEDTKTDIGELSGELRKAMIKEIKSYLLGEVKTLTKETAKWVAKLLGVG